ncbi:MAG: nucleotide exchange factor GrpE [Chloroflexi bacterium]|nr:nucleotide exchange factor GrpE [Chloroflexota bacterium]
MTDETQSPADEDVPETAGTTEPAEDAEVNTAGDSPTGDATAVETDGAGAAPADPVEALQAEVDQLKAQYQRAMADYQNLERRSREERQEVGRFAIADAIRSFLPILDDLDRAVELAEREQGEAGWLDGIRLVVQKFRGVLQQHGVEEIHALGQPFDPNKHEAVGPAPGPDGQVVHLLQRGYVMKDRIIRPAMVMVGNGEDTPGDPTAG